MHNTSVLRLSNRAFRPSMLPSAVSGWGQEIVRAAAPASALPPSKKKRAKLNASPDGANDAGDPPKASLQDELFAAQLAFFEARRKMLMKKEEAKNAKEEMILSNLRVAFLTAMDELHTVDENNASAPSL